MDMPDEVYVYAEHDGGERYLYVAESKLEAFNGATRTNRGCKTPLVGVYKLDRTVRFELNQEVVEHPVP